MMNLLAQYKGLRKENYILFIGRIVTNMGSMIWPVLTLILNQKLGMNATEISFITILSGVIFLPVGVIGGKLADRYNKKKIIIIADFISILFFFAAAIIPLSLKTIALLFIGSAFQNLENPAYTALIADITETKDRERAYSLSYLGANIGLVASPTIAGLLFDHYLWLSFVISGVAIGCSTILIVLFVKNITPFETNAEEEQYQNADENASVWNILKSNKLVLLYVLVMGIFWACYGEWSYLLPLELGRVHNEKGAILLGTISSVNCIIVVFCTPVLTKLFEKVTKTVQTLIGTLLLSAGFVIFLLALNHIPFYYLAISFFTFGEILVTIVSGAFITERIPSSHRGRVTGVQTLLQNLIYGIVIYYTGFLFDSYGNVSAWILVYILLGIVALSILFIVFEDRKRYPMLYEKKKQAEN